MPAWFEWARLHCDAHEETEAKFGEQNTDNPAWTSPLLGTCPAGLFLDVALARNGCNSAADIETALFDQMRPLADLIRESEVRSLAGLRAKTLLSILDFWPILSFAFWHRSIRCRSVSRPDHLTPLAFI
jgi:hypothetical protein